MTEPSRKVLAELLGTALLVATVARSLSDTFAGIAPGSVAMFVLMQLVGGGIALGVIRALYPQATTLAAELAHLESPSPVAAGAATSPEVRP